MLLPNMKFTKNTKENKTKNDKEFWTKLLKPKKKTILFYFGISSKSSSSKKW